MTRSRSTSGKRIAQQILELIVEARFESGHHLREQHLADALGVSRTPIRSGLKELTEMGVVETRPNQGFFLIKAADTLQSLDIEQPQTADQTLYEKLVHDRLNGELPSSFTQTEIAQKYKVDRGILTRTLVRLAEDGLIARKPGQGWDFQQMINSNIALQNSYGFRLMLEPNALLEKHFHIDRQILKRIRARHLRLITHPDITQVPAKEIFETDATFHEAIAEASGNIFVFQAIQQQNRLRRLMEFGSYNDKRRIKAWCEEHLAILDAIRDNNPEKASILLRKHLQYAHDQVTQKVSDNK